MTGVAVRERRPANYYDVTAAGAAPAQLVAPTQAPDWLTQGEVAWHGVAEPAAADPLSEAELSLIWQGQRFPPAALQTTDGESVEVVFPGRLNLGAGPDFRDAVVRLGGRERRGDIELHLRASYFHQHGHDRDPAYDGVVLHVVFVADQEGETRLSNGGGAPIAAFAPWLAQRTADLAAWLAAPASWQPPCGGAGGRRGEGAVEALLAAAGQGRLGAKVAALTAAVAAHGEAQALWAALLDGLGYGGDREAFRRLATRFRPADAGRAVAGLPAGEQAAALTADLLEAFGLSGPPSSAPATTSSFDFASIEGRQPMPPVQLVRRGRPANRPERRLAAFARLYVRAGGDFVAYALAGIATATRPRTLVDAWTVAGLGGGRAAELVFNAVLPFAATRPALADAAWRLAGALPAQAPYAKTAFLEAQLRRPDGGRRTRTALAQQGLLAFLSDWCSRGGCGRCPLSF